MEQILTAEAAERIRVMERCFDELQEAAARRPASLREDPNLRQRLQCLTRYYESGQWLHDYELDEQGLLPRDLKRGVLAQDAVYEFLDAMKGT